MFTILNSLTVTGNWAGHASFADDLYQNCRKKTERLYTRLTTCFLSAYLVKKQRKTLLHYETKYVTIEALQCAKTVSNYERET